MLVQSIEVLAKARHKMIVVLTEVLFALVAQRSQAQDALLDKLESIVPDRSLEDAGYQLSNLVEALH